MTKLKVINNSRVAYLMKAGKDIVKGQMDVSQAESLMKKGSEESTEFPGFGILADGKYYLETITEIVPSVKGEKPITKKRDKR